MAIKQKLAVTIEELPEEEVIAAQQKGKQQLPGKQLGMILEPLSDESFEKLGVKNGLLVKKIGEGPAKKAGIRAGDVLVAINNKKITDIKTLEKIIAEPALKIVQPQSCFIAMAARSFLH